MRSGRGLRAGAVHRALRVRRGKGLDWLSHRQERDPGQPPRRHRQRRHRDGAYGQGHESKIQGNLRRRFGPVPDAVLTGRAMSQAADRRGAVALGAVTVAWLITSLYYCYQYLMRSAPAVMVPQMSD